MFDFSDLIAYYPVAVGLSLLIIVASLYLFSRPGTVLLIKLAFFARYSLLAAVVFLGLIPLGLWLAPQLLGNLFVFERMFQLAFATFLSLAMAEMVVVTFRVTRDNAPVRFREYRAAIEDLKQKIDEDARAGPPSTVAQRWERLMSPLRKGVFRFVQPPPGGVPWSRLLLFLVLGLPLPVVAGLVTANEWVNATTPGLPFVPHSLPAYLVWEYVWGVILFILLQFVLGLVEKWLLPGQIRLPDLYRIDRWFRRPAKEPSPPSREEPPTEFWNKLGYNLNRWLGAGYAEEVVPEVPEGEESKKHYWLWPGHAQLVIGWIVLLAVYNIFYLWGYFFGPPAEFLGFSALAYVMVILLLGGLALSGLAFLFDYLRVPAEVFIVLMAFLLYIVNKTDHYYTLEKEEGSAEVLPLREVYGGPGWKDRFPELPVGPVAEKKPAKKRTMVVVTASGGGIQAAAWAGRVLAGLHDRYEEFEPSVGLISSVSGGSVGAMYYLDQRAAAVDPQVAAARLGAEEMEQVRKASPALSPWALDKIREASRASSLEATAWGLSHPDLLRVIFPPAVWDREIDRGWAIEQAWMAHLIQPNAKLSQWRTLSREGKLPVVVFNAALVETGQRFLVSPVRQPSVTERIEARIRAHGLQANEETPDEETRRAHQAVDLTDLYKGFDLPAVTAARLSATFPYVSPICRPLDSPDLRWVEKKDYYHVADGGYFDNEGVFTALDWSKFLLDHYQSADPRPFSRIILIRVQPAPLTVIRDPARMGGWEFSFLGPLQTIQAVRSASQLERNDLAVETMETAVTETAKSAGDFNFNLQQMGFDQTRENAAAAEIEFLSVSLTYEDPGDCEKPNDNKTDALPRQDIPLSWKLTSKQQRKIDCAWDRINEIKTAPPPGRSHPIIVLDKYFTRKDKRAQ